MGDDQQTSRQDRLKAALRDNLRRRKAQARARGDTTVRQREEVIEDQDGSPNKKG